MATYLKNHRIVDSTIAFAEKQNENKKSYNDYEDFVSAYVEGFVGNLFSDGIEESLTSEILQEWMSNPENAIQEIQNYMAHMYYADGNYYQLATIFRTLPDLNYNIEMIDTEKSNNNKNQLTIRQALKKVNYKELTRDLLSQACVNGTVVCTWLGEKKKPYLHIFSKNQYVFPKYRLNGEWVAVIDLEWFSEMEEEERAIWFETLKGVVSESDFTKYQNNTSDETIRYVELPIETTKVIRVNTLFRDQRIGIPFGTQYLTEYVHKKSFKALEMAIANKIIKNLAVLKIGNDKNTYTEIGKGIRNQVIQGVRKTLQKTIGDRQGTPLAVIPDWAELKFADFNGLDGLDENKYKELDNDISKDLGIPMPMLTGVEGSSASMKYSYTFLYKRIGEVLEQIEGVFNKMIYVILGNKNAENYWFNFDKRVPLDQKDVLSALQALHSEGFAIKPIIDILPDVEFQNYISQTLYEQDVLGLKDTIYPYKTSYTGGGDDGNDGGRPALADDDLGDEGVKARDGGKNENI